MACERCKKSPDVKCGCGDKVKVCGCPVKVETKCVRYNGESLTPLGVIKGDNLEQILKRINELFCEVDVKLDETFLGQNVGLGVEIYKGKNADGYHEFRTLHAGNGILLSQTANGVEIKADSEFINTHIRNNLNDAWFKNHLKSLIKEDWFIEYLQTVFQQSWFENIVQYWIKQEWFRDYVEQLLRESWFIRLLSELMRQEWFVKVLKDLLHQPWFSEVLNSLLREPWFADLIKDITEQDWFRQYVVSIVRQSGNNNIRETLERVSNEEWFKEIVKNIVKDGWFTDYVKSLLNQSWFKTLLFSTLDSPDVKSYISNYILGLINSDYLNLCEVLKNKCNFGNNTAAPRPNTPGRATGDIRYNVDNRGTKTVSVADFDRVFVDDEGDLYTAIKIVGGDLTGLTLRGLPLNINQVISKTDISLINFVAKNQDAAYEQVVLYEFV